MERKVCGLTVGMLNTALFKKTVIVPIIFSVFASVYAQQDDERQDVGNKPTAVKLLVIEKATTRAFKTSMTKFWKSYDPEVPLYIINYGSPKEIHRREDIILKGTPRLSWEGRSRITMVRGGIIKGGPRSVFWKVPYGADNPIP